MFSQSFLSTLMTRCTIISYKHSTYELPHDLPCDLRLRILGNIMEVPKLRRIIASAQSSCQNNIVNTCKNSSKTEIKLFL